MENLKLLRTSKKLTQEEASKYLQVSLRSYKTYENDEKYKNTLKYNYFLEKLNNYNYLDEEHGLLTIDEIKSITSEIFKKYDVNFCYLFGSYSKNKQNEKSDVDLLIDSSITGLDFYGLVEELRISLKKKVDLLKINQLNDNEELLRNILKEGIKIYG